MKRIRITHETQYHYHQPVSFGAHHAMMRPPLSGSWDGPADAFDRKGVSVQVVAL